MSDSATQTRSQGVYGEICRNLDTRKSENETADEFKVRVMKQLNSFSEEEFNELPEIVQHWASSTSRVMQNNHLRQRPQALPQMLGLDAVIRRYDITKPPEQKTTGRRRVKGEDAITRIFNLLVEMDHPEQAKAKEVTEQIKQKYNTEYSNSAVNQAIHAFNTARQVLGVGQNQQRHAAE
jgi:hypothetical protein